MAFLYCHPHTSTHHISVCPLSLIFPWRLVWLLLYPPNPPPVPSPSQGIKQEIHCFSSVVLPTTPPTPSTAPPFSWAGRARLRAFPGPCCSPSWVPPSLQTLGQWGKTDSWHGTPQDGYEGNEGLRDSDACDILDY